MDKSKLCEMFVGKLKEWRVNHQVFNNGFHIQIQKVHNFYPTKQSYYNSESGHKCFYPAFKDGNDFLKWLSERTIETPKEKSFTVTEILEYLDDCETLDDAIIYFHNQKQK